MSTVTIRPDGTAAIYQAAATGAGSVDAALSDSSDSSYVASTSSSSPTPQAFVIVSLGTTTLPAGSVVKRALLTLRSAVVNPSTSCQAGASVSYPGGGILASLGTVYPNWTSPSNLSAAYDGPLTQAQVDALTIRIDKSPGPALRFHETWIDLTIVPRPEVAVTAPSGMVTTTNVPPITWTPTLDPDGGPQTRWVVTIYQAGDMVQRGEGTGTATSWTPAPLPDGDYTAHVLVAQVVNGEETLSDGVSGALDFTIHVALPGVPTLDVETYPTEGFVGLHLAATSGASTDLIAIERSDDGGGTWAPIRTRPVDSAMAALLVEYGLIDLADGTPVDWEAPLSTPLLYRARALHSYSGAIAASAWAVSAPATLDPPAESDQNWWLKHPTDPSLKLAVSPHSWPTRVTQARQGAHQALGAATAMVITDTRAATTTSIVLRVDSLEDRDTLDALVDSLAPLLLQGPPDYVWTDHYVAVGDLTRTRFLDKAFVPETLDTLPLTLVQRPTDAITAPWPDLILLGDMVDGGSTTFTPDDIFDGGTP